MTRIPRTALTTTLLFCAVTFAQAPAVPVQPAKGGYFTSAQPLDLSLIVPPPAQDSAATQADLVVLHTIEQTRTQAQVAAAQADEKQENMFYLRSVLGDKFSPENLPLTAVFAAHLQTEQAAAVVALKVEYQRPRPYQFDPTLHPVCGTTTQPNSYPSGHAVTGYLEAFAVIKIVPEKSREIMQRADDFTRNRLVCGAHYPSDLAAGRDVAYAVFSYLLASPSFQTELAAARTETRKGLGFN
jgi:acid phosphatase (class A)